MCRGGFAKRLFLLPLAVLFVAMAAALVDLDDDRLDSDCYTVNGADYAGNQSYVTIDDVKAMCLPWSMSGHDEFAHLPMNYCRNPNGSVFPWCFVFGANGSAEMRLCDIERCSTPAYLGCFTIPDESNHTVVRKNDDKMKISKCLKFCRDQRFDLGGLFQGRSCRCLTEEDEFDDDKVSSTLCLHNHCGGDAIHACGGENVMAVYDTTAGMCGGVFYQQTHGIIYSPRWPGPYQHNMTCDWSVHVPSILLGVRDDLQLTLEFVHFDLQPDNDLLSIHSLDAVTSPSPETYAIYHGSHVPPARKLRMALHNIRSVILHFESDHSIEHFGFTVLFSIVNATSIDEDSAVEIFQQSHSNAELTSTATNNNTTNNNGSSSNNNNEEPTYEIRLTNQQKNETAQVELPTATNNNTTNNNGSNSSNNDGHPTYEIRLKNEQIFTKPENATSQDELTTATNNNTTNNNSSINNYNERPKYEIRLKNQQTSQVELPTATNNDTTNNNNNEQKIQEFEREYEIRLKNQQISQADVIVGDEEMSEDGDVIVDMTTMAPPSTPDVTLSTTLTEVASGNVDAGKGKIPGRMGKSPHHQTLGVMVGSAFCASLLLLFAILLMYELVRRKRKHQQLTTGLELQQQQQQQQQQQEQQNFNNPIQMIS